jgi:hypothetical protein
MLKIKYKKEPIDTIVFIMNPLHIKITPTKLKLTVCNNSTERYDRYLIIKHKLSELERYCMDKYIIKRT